MNLVSESHSCRMLCFPCPASSASMHLCMALCWHGIPPPLPPYLLRYHKRRRGAKETAALWNTFFLHPRLLFWGAALLFWGSCLLRQKLGAFADKNPKKKKKTALKKFNFKAICYLSTFRFKIMWLHHDSTVVSYAVLQTFTSAMLLSSSFWFYGERNNAPLLLCFQSSGSCL